MVGGPGAALALSGPGRRSRRPVRQRRRRGGATYYVRACFAAPVTGVAFDLSFHEDAAAGGSRLAWQRSDGVADGAGCYRSSPGAYAPCGAAWARFQATASPDVAPESLHLVR